MDMRKNFGKSAKKFRSCFKNTESGKSSLNSFFAVLLFSFAPLREISSVPAKAQSSQSAAK
jgi:hypothetical protein